LQGTAVLPQPVAAVIAHSLLSHLALLLCQLSNKRRNQRDHHEKN